MNVGTETYRQSKLAAWFSEVVDREQRLLQRKDGSTAKKDRWEEKCFGILY